jgi:adenine-specific DNA-methyltransferase
MMLPRLQLLREFLREDGSIWVTIDDNEGHYLKVLMDELFGRGNFIATAVWQKNHARNNSAQHLSADHDFVLAYGRSLSSWQRNKVARTVASDADFWNPDADSRGMWRRSDLTAAKPYADGHYEVVGPHGNRFAPRANRFWSISRRTFEELLADNRIWWGKTGRTFPFRKRFQSELGELVPTTIWLNEDVGNNREVKQEVTRVFGREDGLWNSKARASHRTDPPQRLKLPRAHPRLLPRQRHHRRRRAQDGPALDRHRDGRTRRRALPAAPAEGGGR